MTTVRLFSVSLMCAMLISCSSLTVDGKIENGIYTSPTGEFSVRVPELGELGGQDAVLEKWSWVQFYFGRGYWTVEGLYGVDYVDLESTIDPYGKTWDLESLMRVHLGFRFEELVNFKLIESTYPNDSSYQILAHGTVDEAPCALVCTAVLHQDHVAYVSWLCPFQSALAASAAPRKLPVPNPSFNRMVDSLRMRQSRK